MIFKIDSMNTQVHDTTGRSPYELVIGQMPREVVFPSSKKTAIILEEDLEADGVVLDSVDCHNSVITTKSTNDSKELCQEGNLCIGQNPDVSKCDDGEPEFLLKDDDDDKHDETSGVNFEFRNPGGNTDCDGEFPNVIVDADGEHDNDEAATSDVHESDADGVFHNEIEDVHILKHNSGCEDDEGVTTDIEDLGDEKEGLTIDTNSDGLVLKRSKHLATTKKHVQVY